MGTVINLEDLKASEPGMVLAEPIFNQFGQMLLASGTELQLRHVKVLKTWGCKAVTVLNEKQETETPRVTPEIVDRARSRVLWRMPWEPQTPLEKEIQHLAIKQVIQKFLGS